MYYFICKLFGFSLNSFLIFFFSNSWSEYLHAIQPYNPILGARAPADTIGYELALNTYHYFRWPWAQKDTEKVVKTVNQNYFSI